MDIRITSGKYKGRKIMTPGGGTHPMGERERLALFNMISSYLPGARVLDAFAGSGVLGIEALSRGAAEVVFVEKNRQAAAVIRKNLESIGVQASVECTDAVNYDTPGRFEVILADPPYDKYDISKLIKLPSLLESGGVLALSHPGEAPEMPGLIFDKSRKYAGATISIYVKG